ncbi:hypothetical protein [Candidatus Uabimicrobium sp. HlEnr_7]
MAEGNAKFSKKEKARFFSIKEHQQMNVVQYSMLLR